MKNRIFFLLLFVSQFSSVFSNINCSTAKPSYVWIDAKGEGRNVYAYFRNEFELKELPEKAYINLYAKSLYNLVVNGQFVNFGPIRSYETHPYFDSLNIAPYLKKGRNIVAVKVQSNGIHTYQIPYGTGGFIAWGKIETPDADISLSTPGNWIARRAKGYNDLSPRFSFAQGPVEIFDATAEPDDWKGNLINDKLWKKPVLLTTQNYFGELKARTIPFLTNTPQAPLYVLNKLDLTAQEDVYKWSSYYENVENPRDLRGILSYTYIYSPTDQDVTLGFSWGRYWINNKLIKSEKQNDKAFRSNATIRFKKGWNSFFSLQEIIWSNLDGMLALPKLNNLQFSVNKKNNDTKRFAITEPIEIQKLNVEVPNDSCPAQPEKLKYKWKILSGNEPLFNPAKEIAWLNKKIIPVDPLVINDIVLPENANQAVTYDFGTIHLGRVFINVDAPKGTIFDLVWSEDIYDSIVPLFRRLEVNAITRFISDGSGSIETFRPYGLRYLQVNVRNNSAPVTIHQVGINRQVYDFKKTGSFECSDPLLNKIWEMGWRTLQVCSEDSYTDTPYRERGHYAGDFFPEFATTLATSGDPRLAKHTVRLFIQEYKETYSELAPVRHTDFPLINILVASWYIRRFNDVEFAREVYPVFADYLRLLNKSHEPGELYRIGKVFIEWIKVDKNADLTSLQSYMYASFSNVAVLAKMINKPQDAIAFESMATDVKKVILEKCWDEAAGNFVDGFRDNKLLPTRHVISSSLASVWKIPKEEQERRIQNWFDDALINIGQGGNRNQLTTPYGGFYALASLYQSGNAITAEKFIRKHWGKMVYELNDLTWEDFSRDGQSTVSHAWASSPTYYMSSQILGVDLGFPSYSSPDTIYIRPQTETITWAKGTVPHPKGLVSVDWKIQGDVLFLNYTTPVGIPVVVEPCAKLKKFRLIINNAD